MQLRKTLYFVTRNRHLHFQNISSRVILGPSNLIRVVRVVSHLASPNFLGPPVQGARVFYPLTRGAVNRDRRAALSGIPEAVRSSLRVADVLP